MSRKDQLRWHPLWGFWLANFARAGSRRPRVAEDVRPRGIEIDSIHPDTFVFFSQTTRQEKRSNRKVCPQLKCWNKLLLSLLGAAVDVGVDAVSCTRDRFFVVFDSLRTQCQRFVFIVCNVCSKFAVRNLTVGKVNLLTLWWFHTVFCTLNRRTFVCSAKISTPWPWPCLWYPRKNDKLTYKTQ